MNLPLSYLEISRENLLHNVRAFRTCLHPSTKLGVVIKGNAYGHGQKEVSSILENEVDYFLIDDIEELRLLRATSEKPCLVMGYIAQQNLQEAVQLGCELVVYDQERLPLLQEIASQLGQEQRVHLKIDTFLGRQGILPDQVEHFAELLKQYPAVKVVAAYSHFANIEDTADFSHANKQIETLNQAVATLQQHGFPELGSHISATSGVMVYEKSQPGHILARVGIGAYGMYPSKALEEQEADMQLQPALRWVSHVAQVKTVPAGFPIGYGLTHVTNQETKIAIIPQGYSDGYDRGLSNKGEVLIQGTRCRVLGRVAMNMCTVDVSHLANVQPEDEVVLLGTQGNQKITAEELAAAIDTINYEITTRISPLLPRNVV